MPGWAASTDGRLRTARGHLTRGYRHRSGYLRVDTPVGTRMAHRLVAEAFHGPAPEGMECRHLDGTRDNNRPSNLAWGTPVENAADRRRHGTNISGERHGAAKLTAADVAEIRKRRAAGETLQSLADEYGVHNSTIHKASVGQSFKEVA